MLYKYIPSVNQLLLLVVGVTLTFLTEFCQGKTGELTSTPDSTLRIVRIMPHFGMVLPHHEDMVYFVNDFSYGLDLNIGLTKYNQEWYQYLNYPEVGFGLFYNTFGNSQIYGEGITAYSYIQSNLVRGERFSLNTKVGAGLGYVTRPFNIESNPYNHVFGSHLNVFINMGVLAKYRISSHWSASLNFAINHLSNGATKKPNHGINTLTCGFGVEYSLNGLHRPYTTERVRAPHSNARDFVFVASYGRSQRSPYKPENYPAVTFNVNHLWWISKKTAWGVGVDGIYYGAAPFEYVIVEEQYATEQYDFTAADKLYGGIFGSYNFRFNRTQLYAHIGVYVVYKTTPAQLVYPRMGVRQALFKNIYANVSIKASFFKAEFIEFGLGYRLNYKKNTL